MKKHLIRASVLALAAAAGSFAETPTVTANIPFDFIVAGRNLPAGHYSTNQLAGLQIVTLKSADANAGVVVSSTGGDRVPQGTQARLVFHRYGNLYFLSGIWIPGAPEQVLPQTRGEQEVAKRTPGGSVKTVVAFE